MSLLIPKSNYLHTHFKKEKAFLPTLCGIHPFATCRRGNLSNMAEGIVGK